MPGMTALGASSAPVSAVRSRRLSLTSILVPAATALTILGLALLPLLTPWFMHPALDAADSAARLGMTPQMTYQLSDATVHDLVSGGDFALQAPGGGPFFTAAEAAHMRDARTLLYAFLAVGLLSAVLVVANLAVSRDRQSAWRLVRRGSGGLAIAVVVGGVIGFFAFEPAFELFHRIFFPGGNWAFDPATSELVRLYPYLFWQIAAGSLGAVAVGLAAPTWWFSRRRALAPADVRVTR
jgi:integral membrane protein (TIGR01906 family)